MKVFLADEGYASKVTRKLARGHKLLSISENVQVMDTVDIRTDGTSLLVEKAEADGSDEIYTILCKEFGLVGLNQNVLSDISVIFCDGGWMLVTLHSGGLIVNLNGKPMLPTVGAFDVTSVSDSDILWVNANNLLAYRKYMQEIKSMFTYDFEFRFTVGGCRTNGCASLQLNFQRDKDVDISLGEVAQYQQKKEVHEQAKRASALYDMFVRTGTDNEEYEYEYEYDEAEEEYDDDDEEEW